MNLKPKRHSRRVRIWRGRLFKGVCVMALLLALSSLAMLLIHIFYEGITRVNWGFLVGYSSRFPLKAGIFPALVGSVYMMVLTALLAFPLGVAAAIYFEEYGKSGQRNWIHHIIEINIANLAGVPSVIYGILGLTIFVRWMGFGQGLISGALTLALLILPIIIIASREAIRAVPSSIREASYALGATRWQTIQHQILPSALPGIITATILALSRAIGETAPLITIGALTYVAFLPENLFSPFTVLPIQIFNWVSRPQAGFHVNAAAAICVLLPLLLLMNGLAIWLRGRYYQRPK